MSAPPAATVVVVEDDLALLQALRFMLLSEGFEALGCETAEALLGLELPPERLCLVIDERLPNAGSGVAALQALRARGVLAPAIVITTAPDAALRQAVSLAGANLVEKPLLGDALLSQVKTLLAGPG